MDGLELVCPIGRVEGYSFSPQPLSFICAASGTEHPVLDLITSRLGTITEGKKFVSFSSRAPACVACLVQIGTSPLVVISVHWVP